MKKVLYYAFIILIVFVALLLISSQFPMMKHQVMAVRSGSMEPAIKTGSVVLVTPVKKYKIGDVITYKGRGPKEESITHRIENTEVIEGEMLYITKGDANNAPDSRKITEDEIIGRTIFWVPYVGYVVNFAKKPVGLLIIILIPAVMIIVDEGRKIVKEIKKLRAKKSEKKD